MTSDSSSASNSPITKLCCASIGISAGLVGFFLDTATIANGRYFRPLVLALIAASLGILCMGYIMIKAQNIIARAGSALFIALMLYEIIDASLRLMAA